MCPSPCLIKFLAELFTLNASVLQRVTFLNWKTDYHYTTGSQHIKTFRFESSDLKYSVFQSPIHHISGVENDKNNTVFRYWTFLKFGQITLGAPIPTNSNLIGKISMLVECKSYMSIFYSSSLSTMRDGVYIRFRSPWNLYPSLHTRYW